MPIFNTEYKSYYDRTKDYQEVEYIQSSGTQYFILGTEFKTEYKSVIDFQMTVTGGDYIPLGLIVGSGSSAQKYGINAYASYFKVVCGGSNWSNTKAEDTNRHTIVIDKSTATVDGTNYSIGYASYSYSKGICVFAYNDYDNSIKYKASMKLYKLDIYNGSGTHIYDLAPCYRKSDNVIGMYDTINGVFYTNQGTGVFTKGPDVN